MKSAPRSKGGLVDLRGTVLMVAAGCALPSLGRLEDLPTAGAILALGFALWALVPIVHRFLRHLVEGVIGRGPC
jgi:hypothetical protein